MEKNTYYLLLLNRIDNYTPAQKIEIYRRYKSFEEIFINRKEIENIYNKKFKISGKSFTEYNKDEIEREIEEEIYYCQKNSVKIIDIESPGYPEQLRQIFDPPIVIFARGNAELLKKALNIAIVGSRNATNRGLTLAFNIAEVLSINSVTVVSGMAKGVDSYAHRGALNGKGATIAVMANGINIAYPKQNYKLWEKIIDNGLVITEFPFNTSPYRYNFPKRNRIISGLAKAVLIVEATEKSGALITARYALEQGRDVMAMPGEADSEFYRGNNWLIKNGAFLVENPGDIFEIIGKDFIKFNKNSRLKYSDREMKILSIIGEDEVSLDTIKNVSGFELTELLSQLIMLEIKGAIKQKPGKFFIRVK